MKKVMVFHPPHQKLGDGVITFEGPNMKMLRHSDGSLEIENWQQGNLKGTSVFQRGFWLYYYVVDDALPTRIGPSGPH